MKKKVFRYVFAASVITMVLTVAIVISVIYINAAKAIEKEVKEQAMFISQAVHAMPFESSEKYIADIGRDTTNRISLISEDGRVLYDNFVAIDELDNHALRPEVAEAMRDGAGSVTRYSDTLRERIFYYAVRLDDGGVLRIAATRQSVLGMLGNAYILVYFILAYMIIMGILFAHWLTKSITKPLMNLNLEEPLKNQTYEELSELLNSLERKNRRIDEQVLELTKKQREFDAVTTEMKDGLVLFDEHGMIMFVNRSAAEILGSAKEGSYLALCREPAYRSIMEKALNKVASTEKLHRNGHIYRMSTSIASSEYSAIVLYIVDTTETEQAEQMRREFTANVSHELKTPLTSIMGCAELIQCGIAKSGDVPEFADQIYKEAARLLNLIEDIIKLSRLDEAGEGKETEFTPVDLYEVGTAVIKALSSNAKAAGVNLGLSGEKVIISGIRHVLYEMLYNLVDNAIKYNRQNGSVKITLKCEGQKDILQVEDTGIGIAPEYQTRVFERFYRVDKSHSKETGGTGLGLSIVKHGAILHRAEVTLDSKLSVGTTIRITFHHF